MPNLPKRTDLAHRLARCRESRGLTQKQLAARLCCPASVISKWETGRRVPQVSQLVKLSELLAVSADELLGTPPERIWHEAPQLAARVRDLSRRLGPGGQAALLALLEALLTLSGGGRRPLLGGAGAGGEA